MNVKALWTADSTHSVPQCQATAGSVQWKLLHVVTAQAEGETNSSPLWL